MELFKHIKIQTNNICTRKCLHCYYGSCSSVSDLRMSNKLFKRIIDNLSKLNFIGRIGLFETNEPLTDSRIFDFIKYSKSKNPEAWHMIASNGDLLNIARLKKLFLSGLDDLKISAYDDKGFNKITQLKAQVPRLSPKIEIIDQRYEKILDNRGGNIEYKGVNSPNKPLNVGCDRIYNVMYIRPNGKVVSCCCDFYEVNYFGNLNLNTIEGIWFGKEFNRFRKAICTGNRKISPLCSKCNYGGKGGFFKTGLAKEPLARSTKEMEKL